MSDPAGSDNNNNNDSEASSSVRMMNGTDSLWVDDNDDNDNDEMIPRSNASPIQYVAVTCPRRAA